MIGGIGFGEMVLVFAVLLLLFGAKRLPELASGMGKGIRDFKRSLNGLDDDSLGSRENPNSIAPGESTTATPMQHSAESEPKRLQD